jgi:hypothetical protein
MFDLAEVGSVAPALALHAADDDRPRHRPRLLAFVRAWAMEREDLARIRERLAELDSELVIVSDDGAWSFVRNRAPTFCDRLADDAVTAAAAYGVTADAVFVIDHRDVVRFAHRPARPLSATLTEAIDAAAQALEWRSHQTKLERVRWTSREWALKCLVVGCSLTYLAAPVEPRRFARGTGPVVKYESRDVITPRAVTDTGAPQSSAIESALDAPSP